MARPAPLDALRTTRPAVLAGAQTLPVQPALADLLPLGGLARGTTVGTAGPAAGSLALALVAAATQAGSWVAQVGLADLGLAAAAEAGVALERLVLVRAPEPRTWATVVATLVGAFDLVLVPPSPRLGAADARRLAARARERGTVLVVVDRPSARAGAPPLAVDLWVRASAEEWVGLEVGHGHLQARRVQVEVGGRRQAQRPRRATLWLPDPTGAVRVEPAPVATGPGVVVPLERAG